MPYKNSLNEHSANAILQQREDYGTLPIMNEYGGFQVGGSIGVGDVRHQFDTDPLTPAAAGMVEDVMPLAGDLRSVNYHLPNQYEAYLNAQTPDSEGAEGGRDGA